MNRIRLIIRIATFQFLNKSDMKLSLFGMIAIEYDISFDN